MEPLPALRALAAEMGLAEVYEVGGCVRDELMGRPAKDIDLAVVGITAAELLERARRVGRAEELVVAGQLIGVRLHGRGLPREGLEIALARTELSTGPGHTDFAIRADPSVGIREDLGRRDFTVNAIARDLHTGVVVDPYDGAGDVQRRLLRTVAPEAFRDDPLRILRGLARVARDGLAVEAGTWAQMREHAGALSPVGDDWPLSPERIFAEYEKALTGDGAARAFGLARDLGVLQATIPEWAPGVGFDQESSYHDLTVDEHELLALDHAARHGFPLVVRWAALLHDVGKPASAWRGPEGRLHYYGSPELGLPAHEELGARLARTALTRLRAPRHLIDPVRRLVAEHMYREDDAVGALKGARARRRARAFLARVGREDAPGLLQLRRADRAGKRPGAEEEAGWDADCTAFEALVAEQWDAPTTVGELAIDGRQLMALGLRGPAIGAAQRALLARVVAEPEKNTEAQLIAWAGQSFGS